MTQYQNYYNNKNISFRTYLNRTFLNVAIGLIVSSICAFFVASNYFKIALAIGYHNMWIASLVVCVLELGVAFYFNGRLLSMSKGTAWACFLIYSALTGISLSSLLLVYDVGSVVMALATTAIVFACMAFIGATTKIDLSKFGSLVSIGLSSIIIVSLLNSLIFHSSFMDLLICYAGIIIFLGIIAFDMQRLRSIFNSSFSTGDMYGKVLIYGAFQLYLDFINLFIRVLQVFGRRRDD